MPEPHDQQLVSLCLHSWCLFFSALYAVAPTCPTCLPVCCGCLGPHSQQVPLNIGHLSPVSVLCLGFVPSAVALSVNSLHLRSHSKKLTLDISFSVGVNAGTIHVNSTYIYIYIIYVDTIHVYNIYIHIMCIYIKT